MGWVVCVQTALMILKEHSLHFHCDSLHLFSVSILSDRVLVTREAEY